MRLDESKEEYLKSQILNPPIEHLGEYILVNEEELAEMRTWPEIRIMSEEVEPGLLQGFHGLDYKPSIMYKVRIEARPLYGPRMKDGRYDISR